MKAVIFSGSHKRHLYYNSFLSKHFENSLIIIMERENVMPDIPIGLDTIDKKNFQHHFSTRKLVEDKKYGNIHPQEAFSNCELIKIKPDELNSDNLAEKIKKFNADICFIFGADIIRDPVFRVLPVNKINLHLGISPWFRGSATLFWPFYLLKPQFAGVTFHQITKNPDAGEIIHQCSPKLEYGDEIHDVGAKCVIKAKNEVIKIINFFKKNKKFNGIKQKTNGKLWKVSDFHSSHLRTIYNLFNNKIVDLYLDGKLDKQVPTLLTCIK